MRMIYMIVADVLKALGWEVEINEKDSYWNLVLTNTTSSEDMPQSHKSCLRGLLRGWLMEFNYEGGRQQVNIYKELHGLNPEDDRYSCLDTCVNRTDGNTPQYKLDDKEVFVRRKDRFDRYVLAEPVSENITTRLLATQQSPSAADNSKRTHARLVWCMVALYAWLIFCIIYWLLGFSNWITTVSNTMFTLFFIYLVDFERRRINKNKE